MLENGVLHIEMASNFSVQKKIEFNQSTEYETINVHTEGKSKKVIIISLLNS